MDSVNQSPGNFSSNAANNSSPQQFASMTPGMQNSNSGSILQLQQQQSGAVSSERMQAVSYFCSSNSAFFDLEVFYWN
ncbi:MAG: hypothetical protein MHMPM18_004053 [Marteilia pararefringens]